MSERLGVILVAAGRSARMGFDKIWASLGGRPLVQHSLETLVRAPGVDDLVLVVAAEHLARARALCASLGLKARVCAGGERRRDSVAAGLATLPDVAWLAVHDAARPFVPAESIARGLEAARETGAAVAALPARDTIKRVVSGRVVETLPRAELWIVQTPQVFRASLLRDALTWTDDDVTDEAALVEAMGGLVTVFAGSDHNWKITTAGDLELAHALAARRAERMRRAHEGAYA